MVRVLLSLILSLGLTACMNSVGGPTREPLKINTVPLNESQKAFKDTLFNTLVSQCGQCHGTIQGPLFATPSRPGPSHDALIKGNLVDFTNRAGSVIVQRVRGGHNCFSGSCDDDADLILDQITQWASRIDPNSVPTGPVTDSLVVPAQTATSTICNETNGVLVTYDLREIDSSLPNPTQFQIRIAQISETNYEICDPQINTTAALQVEDIKVIMNGAVVQPNSSWRNINVTTIANGTPIVTNLHGGTSGVFSPGALIIPIGSGPGEDEFAFEFRVLE